MSPFLGIVSAACSFHMISVTVGEPQSNINAFQAWFLVHFIPHSMIQCANAHLTAESGIVHCDENNPSQNILHNAFNVAYL